MLPITSIIAVLVYWAGVRLIIIISLDLVLINITYQLPPTCWFNNPGVKELRSRLCYFNLMQIALPCPTIKVHCPPPRPCYCLHQKMYQLYNIRLTLSTITMGIGSSVYSTNWASGTWVRDCFQAGSAFALNNRNHDQISGQGNVYMISWIMIKRFPCHNFPVLSVA